VRLLRLTGQLTSTAALLSTLAMLHAGAWAHDAGIQNGVFRSRDGGATWLQVNAESFARGVLALAVHPSDPHHLLLATDSGLLRSRNGGRDWEPEAQQLLTGTAFAVAFDGDGEHAIACGANALYRFEDKRWRPARTPDGSAPARALVSGGMAGRAYLAGWTGLHRTDNGGRSWARVGSEIGHHAVTALAVSATRPDELHALAAGRVWHSSDAARHWRADDGAPPQAEALAIDRGLSTRLWVMAAGRAHRLDVGHGVGAARWEPVGTPIPDPQAKARDLHAMRDVLLVATDRGVFRSADAGATWTLLKAELPDHSETALLGDPHDSATIYAGFTRLSAQQLRDASIPQDATFARSDIALAVAAYAGFALLLLGVGVIVRRCTRAAPSDAARGPDEMRIESPS
jgi:photosystem II stability/assembly factor-like uncharacterized protein